MANTGIWVVAVVGLSTLLGFIVAMALNASFSGARLSGGRRLSPGRQPLVVQASIWNYIIKYEYGNLNNILLNLGIITNPINWRISYQIEFMWECGVGIFVTIPFVAFTCLAGLQSIDAVNYEAATVDGAGFWKKLRHVTIPLLRPSLTISTVLNIIYVFNSFPIVYTITKGAPAHKTDTMVTFLYMLAYAEQEMGAATALSVIGFLILAVVGAYDDFMRKRPDDPAEESYFLLLFGTALLLLFMCCSCPLPFAPRCSASAPGIRGGTGLLRRYWPNCRGARIRRAAILNLWEETVREQGLRPPPR